jgi:5,10-methylenetetrahydromethanopterin reductase
LTLSCALATSSASPEHARIAESLGYERVFLYDSPALHSDVWVQLCRAAERTTRIGLGPAAVVPSNRHPMTTAAAIATLAECAGQERVTIAVGAGGTGRLAMGKRPLPWTFVSAYVRAVQGLLRGDTVTWDDAPVRMLHPEGFAPGRPINVKWVIAAGGPKGVTAAQELADGVFAALVRLPGIDPFELISGFDWSVLLTFGTVLDDGEDPGGARALAAAGPAGALALHFGEAYRVLDDMLGADAARTYRAAYADVPADQQHLAQHDGHLMVLGDRDRPFVTGELLAGAQLAMPGGAWSEKLTELEAAGATEVAYQPAGPDIARELEAFAAAARG